MKKSALALTSLLLCVVASAWLAACTTTSTGGPTLAKEETEAQKAGTLNKQLGTVYLRQGNLALAKEKLERAEKYNPRDPEIHSVLALLYERLDIPKEVEAHYRTAIRLAPNNPGILNNYAIYLCKNGRTEEGVKRFLEAAKNPLYRTPEAAYTNAGVCLRQAKKLDDATTSFKRALTIAPSNAEAVYQLADLDRERGQLAPARELIDKYLTTNEATPDILGLGVRIARAQKDRLAEEKYLRRLRVEFPSSEQLRALSEQKRNPG
jgi:type IV pilus assembly protein PilF